MCGALRGRLALRWAGGGCRARAGLVLVPETPVLGAQLVQPPLQLVDPLPLGMDEALLVLYDAGQFPQVEHSPNRVLQEVLHPGTRPVQY